MPLAFAPVVALAVSTAPNAGVAHAFAAVLAFPTILDSPPIIVRPVDETPDRLARIAPKMGAAFAEIAEPSRPTSTAPAMATLFAVDAPAARANRAARNVGDTLAFTAWIDRPASCVNAPMVARPVEVTPERPETAISMAEAEGHPLPVMADVARPTRFVEPVAMPLAADVIADRAARTPTNDAMPRDFADETSRPIRMAPPTMVARPAAEALERPISAVTPPAMPLAAVAAVA
jgi:hypothetical protein